MVKMKSLRVSAAQIYRIEGLGDRAGFGDYDSHSPALKVSCHHNIKGVLFGNI
jgi:hypothetical protein